MKRRILQWALVLVTACALAPLPASGAGAAGRPPAGDVRLLTSTATELTFRVTVPWARLRADPFASTGYVQLYIPGWAVTAQPGAPELPFLAQAIGVPFGADLSVEVEAGPAHEVALPGPALPVARQQVEWEPPADNRDTPALPAPSSTIEEDPAVYGHEAMYPGSLAEVASDGVMRQQRVAAIALYPVQYNPARQELTVYEWLRVRVAFGARASNGAEPRAEGSGAAGSPRGPSAESAAYEQLLSRELLNYEAARAWRQTVVPSRSTVPDAASDGVSSTGPATPWAPPAPGWRVRVRGTGLYKLSYTELQTAGLPVDTLDPRTFKVFYLGNQVAIEVAGETDGAFDPGDYVVFYGEAAASKYAPDNVYWLTYGTDTGLRMTSRDGTPGTAEAPTQYTAQSHYEGNSYYVSKAPGDDALERLFWDYLYPSSRSSWSYTFALAAFYGGPGTLKVRLLGLLQNPISPDHHARILLNGTRLGDVRWDGITWQTVEMPIPAGLLIQGNNVLKVEAPNDTGVGSDIIYIDWADLTFANTFQAAGNVLAFGYETNGAWRFQVNGFTTDQLAVYDVTDPRLVVKISGSKVLPGAAYSVQFQDSLAAAKKYRATATTAYRTVQAIEADTASSLGSTANGADYIVITHKDFSSQAEQLRSFRASQGLRTARVDVQDVYDEFGYGLAGATAIRDFLAYAYSHWQAPAPSFAVLLGDGHYDPKNFMKFGRVSFIPPYLAFVDPWIGETAADNRYVTLAGTDNLPDMMLGRLAVNSSQEASAVVDKILAYEQNPVLGDWRGQVLAVADNADSAGDFAQMSDGVLSCCLPAPYAAQRVYYGVTHATLAEARTAIQNGINAGRLIVTFTGHGGPDLWADEGLFKLGDVALLQNGGKLPVMLPMTCYDGYYHRPQATAAYDALAETVTRAAGKGAVASWSPTGLGVATGHEYLGRGFFDAVFTDADRVVTVGAAMSAGKLKLFATGANLDLLDTYLLFGDPAMRIALPAAAPASADLQASMAAVPAGTVTPGTAIEYMITFANNGPDTATGVVLSYPLPGTLISPVASASPGVSLRAGTSFVWDIPDLPAGGGGWVKVSGTVDPALQPPATIANTAQIAGTEADPQTANNTAALSTEIAAPAGPAMHMGAISLSATYKGGRYTIAAATTVLDAAGQPVASATVGGTWTLPSGETIQQQATSTSKGAVSFRTTNTQTGTYQFCVTKVTRSGWVYDASKNVDTCKSLPAAR